MAKHSHYCDNCKKLLFKGDAVELEIVCHRCKALNKITFIKQSVLLTKVFDPDTIKT